MKAYRGLKFPPPHTYAAQTYTLFPHAAPGLKLPPPHTCAVQRYELYTQATPGVKLSPPHTYSVQGYELYSKSNSLLLQIGGQNIYSDDMENIAYGTHYCE